ncbi:MAG: hypothetical protein WC442_00415 [Candidatus Omnitrophota bacterium]
MEITIEELVKRVEALERKIEALGNTTSLGHIGNSEKPKKTTLREFLNLRKPANDVMKTLGIVYFLEKFEGIESVNREDLETAFEKAKERRPLNINDKIYMNIKNGHIAEHSVKKNNLKSWYITGSGETFVESNFKESNSKD